MGQEGKTVVNVGLWRHQWEWTVLGSNAIFHVSDDLAAASSLITNYGSREKLAARLIKCVVVVDA